MKLRSVCALWMVCLASCVWGQRRVTFPLAHPPGQVEADLYGTGARGVILAHGGSFHKESWKKQAEVLAQSGFLVLAVGFRGDRLNPNGSPGSFGASDENAADVLAAVAYLHSLGIRDLSAVGASLGGDAVGDADAQLPAGTLARVVFLGSSGGDTPEKLSGRKLFLLAREDRSSTGLRLGTIQRSYERAAEPKKLTIVEGSAHAQFLFATDQGARVLDEIVTFLTAP